MVDIHLNWSNSFHFLVLVTGPLVILICCMIFLSPFLDAVKVSMSTVSFVAFLTKYSKQRNICVSLVKKDKQNSYENLHLTDINDNKNFWATVKPLFSNKIKSAENIFLDESGEVIINVVEAANVFNKYFMNMVPIMGIANNHNFLSNTGTSDDSLEKIINKYKNYSSIICINKHMANSELTFTFQPITKNRISKLIKLLNDKKAVKLTVIPTKLIKEFRDFFSEFVYKSINHCITEGNFITNFKKAEVHPLYKNDGRADKSGYRQISIVSNVSEIHERSLYSLYNLLYNYFDKNIFSKCQCGFCQDYSTQHVLLVRIEKNENCP